MCNIIMHELAGTVRITVPHQSKALNSHQQVTELMELSFVKQHYAQYLTGGINMSSLLLKVLKYLLRS